MIKSKKKFIIIILGLLFLIIAVPRLMYPDLDHGDEYGDANVMDAGRNFAKFGFIRCRFLPTFEVQLDKPENLYTHYPTLPENINGLLRKIFKTDSLRFFRSIALFFACLDVIFWFLFLEKFTGSYSLGFLGALFYLFNPLFIFSADNLHQLAYSGFLRSLILFSFLCYIESKDRKRLLLFLLWVFIQLEFWIGLDCVIYLFLFFILYKYFFKLPKAPLSKGAIIILFSAPVFGSLLHFMQNVWYFGSFSLALKDLVNVAAERMAHSKDSSLALTFGNWWQYAIVRYFSLVLIFNYFIVSFMII